MTNDEVRPRPVQNPTVAREDIVWSHPSEEEFAHVLDYFGIEWRYEPTTFPLRWDEEGNLVEGFCPDFYLGWKPDSSPLFKAEARDRSLFGVFPWGPACNSTARKRASKPNAISLLAARQPGEAPIPSRLCCSYSTVTLLARSLGSGTCLGNISTADLKEWLTYLREGRGVSCSRMTLSRRMTSLKNFFRWLTREKALGANPSASLVYHRAGPPLPEILFEADCERLLGAASRDSRAYLMILLVLECGLKKGEILRMKLSDLDLANPYRPEGLIRASDPGRRHKTRKLKLPSDFGTAYRRYVREYNPREFLFECCYRLLNDIVAGATSRAGIRKPVSPKSLRDTSAVRQLRKGVEPQVVMRRLGLAPGRCTALAGVGI